MGIDHKTITVFQDSVQLVTVYDGPRGAQGVPGAPGEPGQDGVSITIRGPWASNVSYGPGSAVSAPSRDNPSLVSLFLLRTGKEATVGIAPRLDPDAWMEVGGGGGDGSASLIRVVQVNHPFTEKGQPVAFSQQTGRYEVAHAGDRDLAGIGVIREVVDTTEFLYQVGGEVPEVSPLLLFDPPPPAGRGVGDWVPGSIYYLSTVPGMYQERPPLGATGFSQPMIIATGNPEVGQPANLLMLTWGPDDRTAPSDTPPAEPREGDLWYRRGSWPGLYVALFDVSSTQLMWVQTNG